MTDLRQYDDDYENATAPSFGDVPPGTYQACIERATIEPNKYSSHPDFKLMCRIFSGDQQRKCLFIRQSFDPEKIKWLKATVGSLELDPPVTRASEIGDRLHDMIDRILEIEVKHTPKDDGSGENWVNSNVKRFVCWKAEGIEAMNANLDANGDEIPF
jgi:hypothetical protein